MKSLNSLRKWHFVLLTLLILEIGLVGHAWSHVDEDYAAAELARQRNEPAFVAPQQQSLSADGPLAQQALAVNEPLDQVGQWGPVTTWPFVFASAANLPDGRIIAWGGNNRTTFNGGSNTYTGIWDPTTGQITEDNYAQHSMFCAIPTMRENGQIFVVGGDGTRERTSLFDYRTNNWQRIDDANIGRWYNGSLQLPNGQVFMALGSPGSRYPELWTEGSGWQWLTGIDLQGAILDYTADYGRPEWFPMLTVAPNGEILHVGPTPQMHYITPQGNGSIQETAAGITDWDANNQAGTMIMFDKGKILTLGGVSAKNRATIVDINGATPQVTAVNNLIQPRAHSNAVVLPTGEVLVVGGTSQDVWFSDQGTILTPEIWNPQTQLWREVADHAVPRNYHSVALLMPDGRVFSGGGGLCGCSADHPDHQIYSPSYLFNTDGTLATRPTITSATEISTFGATVDVIATPNIQKFSMIKMSGTTHSHNTDVRFLNVPFSGDNGNYQLTLESNRNVLTPGYWMLFALNEQNIPSIAKVIQVVSEPPVLGAHQYVRLVADSEINGKPWTSMAELNVLDTNGNSLSQASWSVVSFDSEETVGEDGRAVNAIDGNPQTFWHTDWFANAGDDNDPAHPHEIVVNLGASYNLGGFKYLPRPGGGNGTVSAYRFYISTDGVNWGSPVAQGTFANNANEKTILFVPPPGNQAPVVTNPGNQTNIAGDVVSLPISASDPDGDTLSYSAIGLPLGLNMNGNTGVIAGTLASNSAGTYTVTLNISDGTENISVGFTWTVTNPVPVNQPPVVTNPGSQTNIEGDVVNVSISASDPDGDILSYSSSGLPSGLSINGTTGVIGGTISSSGTFNTTVNVFDGNGGQDNTTFTWHVSPITPITIAPFITSPQPTDQSITFTATAGGGNGVLRYKWLFGDNTPETAYSTSATISHTFLNPGRYIVTVTVTDESAQEVSQQLYQAIHRPFTANRPSSSMSVMYESRSGNDRVWAVNPDNNTVSVFDTITNIKVAEIGVGNEPRSLATAPDGRVWVANQDSATLSIIDQISLSVVNTVNLPSGSQPFGLLFDPSGNNGYLALQATGMLLQLNPSNANQTGSVHVGPNPRHIAINSDGSKVYVSRFITPRLPGEQTSSPQIVGVGGEIVVVNTGTMSVGNTIVLAVNNGADFEAGARGVPNYLGAPVISPDGTTAWIPSKQDNILRGTLRDGNNLNFEHTVRAISSRIDLSNDSEDFPARLDHDNAGLGSAGAFGLYGNYYFVALETSREIAVVDTYQQTELFRFDVGRAPQGLAVSPDGLTLYVHNFMDRSIGIYDLSQLIHVGSFTVNNITNYATVANEALSNQVLNGKQLFYDARDNRLARDAYLSCASCHNDGDHDGRVWDLTGFGEGLRNTISLNGRGGSEHGRLHWTSNFDEVQDFEGQIRDLAGGTGLMDDADFNATNNPLGTPKTGLSAALDALAAYVESLTSFGSSPIRESNGDLNPDGAAGRSIFGTSQCASCHGGQGYTDSTSNTLHDIGTIKTSSGSRLGGALTGLDTPTLRGLWSTAPYLHDGSAASLADAVNAHDGASFTTTQLNQLVAFLGQIDDQEPAPPIVNSSPVLMNPGAQTSTEGESIALNLSASDPDGDLLTYSATGLPAGLSINGSTGAITGIVTSTGTFTPTIGVDDGNEGQDSVTFTWTVNPASVNQPPIVTNPGNQTNTAGDPVTLAITASDPDGDPLTYTATGLPAGLTINGVSGAITGTVTTAGQSSVTITVDDGRGGQAIVNFSWTVDPTPSAQDVMYLSSTSGGSVGGISFSDEDILAFNPTTNTWSRYFDGSDVGLSGAGARDVNAFHVLSDGTILLSFIGATTIPDVGTVDDSDIVRFIPTSLGSNTSGRFELYFDGSDVGLTTNGEDIDALHLLSDGRLVLSTIGSSNVIGTTWRDEDLLVFTPTSLGANTSGAWALYFDGSDVGLADVNSEDIYAVWLDDNGDIYLSTRGSVSVSGVNGDGADVLHCVPGSLGTTTQCSFSLNWDGSANGYGGEIVDGLSRGAS